MRWAALFWMLMGGFAEAQLSADGFALAQKGRVFSFPRDHGNHAEFRTEWWYVTGHLDGPKGERFGFQATFFRQGRRGAGGVVSQLHLAHAALLDGASRRFLHEERLQREGWDAGSSSANMDVRNENWQLVEDAASGHIKLAATVNAEAQMMLSLVPLKKLVVFGKDGVSRKGTAEGAASHYLTFPRLGVSGSVRVGSAVTEVTGEAWLDHEFSSSQLDAGQVGWDWAALQLNDGREMMVYRMRRRDGTQDEASTLTWIEKDGSLRSAGAGEFQWTALSDWKSPRTGAVYPQRVRIEQGGVVLELRPLVEDQEHSGAITGLPYWEGACDVLDAQGNVVGRAFLELAGYAGNLGQHLR